MDIVPDSHQIDKLYKETMNSKAKTYVSFCKAAREGDIDFFRANLDSVQKSAGFFHPLDKAGFWIVLAEGGSDELYSFLRKEGVTDWNPESPSSDQLFMYAKTPEIAKFLIRHGYPTDDAPGKAAAYGCWKTVMWMISEGGFEGFSFTEKAVRSMIRDRENVLLKKVISGGHPVNDVLISEARRWENTKALEYLESISRLKD